MKIVLKDHGKILHWAGAHYLFPVRGSGGPNDVAFASPGGLEGRTPIGWDEFFPVLDRTDQVVIADEEEGTMSVGAPDSLLAPDPKTAALAGAHSH
jgi:hypothetical protein